jgi:hypothetical protein
MPRDTDMDGMIDARDPDDDNDTVPTRTERPNVMDATTPTSTAAPITSTPTTTATPSRRAPSALYRPQRRGPDNDDAPLVPRPRQRR